MKVKLVKTQSNEDDYTVTSLSVGKEYTVIGIEGDDYRIICEDDNEPYLYPPDCFEIIDSSIPDFWVTEFGEDGERYSYPPSWKKVGFFEDYFDNVKKIKEQFWKEYTELYKR